jgi:hypothetical protein
MMEKDAAGLCGVRYGRADGKDGYRRGRTKGKLGFHGGKIELERPRVRARDDEADTTGVKQGEERRSGYAFGDHHPTIAVCRSATKIRSVRFFWEPVRGAATLYDAE